MIPSDPIILLSYMNTQLRDKYKSFDDFCYDNEVDEEKLLQTLYEIGYYYNEQQNQFKHREKRD